MIDRLRGAGIVVALIGLVACGLLYAIEKRVPAETELTLFSGRLVRPVTAIRAWKSETRAEVEIETAAGRVERGRIPHMCFLWADCVIPQDIAALKAGDTIAIWLSAPEQFEGDSRFVWRMVHAGDELISLRDTAAANAAQRKGYLTVFGGASLFGVLLAAGAGMARRLLSARRRRS